ncbi:hypothetical protein [Gluconobacter roseus]|nr:hypothetical protein [Gluconobacter roseus]
MASEVPTQTPSCRSTSRPASPTRRWIWRALLGFALAWMAAHFITLGSPKWGPGARHDATIFGQMIAIAVFPILLLIAVGTRSPLRGGLIAGAVCLIAALAVVLSP